MLAEHDVLFLTVVNEEDERRILLEGFASSRLAADHFILAVWNHLAYPENQVPLDPELVSQLDDKTPSGGRRNAR